MRNYLKNEIALINSKIKLLDKKVITIFFCIAILQTVSWYYSSRKFFNSSLYSYFLKSDNIDLYEFLYWFASDTVVLLIIPILIIKFFFKEKIYNYGINFKNFHTGFLLFISSAFIILPLTYVISTMPEFRNYYPMFSGFNQNIKTFLLYESFFLLFLFAWEFIWRGFMLFGLESKFGWYSIFIQMIPFVILHNGKPILETFGAIVGGVFLGALALSTRSMVYGFFIHATVIIALDVYSIL